VRVRIEINIENGVRIWGGEEGVYLLRERKPRSSSTPVLPCLFPFSLSLALSLSLSLFLSLSLSLPFVIGFSSRVETIVDECSHNQRHSYKNLLLCSRGVGHRRGEDRRARV